MNKLNLKTKEFTKIEMSNSELYELLKLAKNGDQISKQKIIDKFYGYIVFQSRGIYLDSYTFEDLVQTGLESILIAIIKFNLDKPIAAFSPYVYLSIKNNFNYLCRKENRHNNLSSLNIEFEDGLESIDLIVSHENLEEVIVDSITSKELLLKLQLLDTEEQEIINFLYLDTSFMNTPNSDKKRCLSHYANATGKDYYYCSVLKKRALKKLESYYKHII